MLNKIFFDIDELVENLYGPDLDIFQLTKSTAPPKLIIKKINDILVQYVSIYSTIEHKGSYDKDYYGFTLSSPNSEEIHKGTFITQNSVIITKPSSQFSGTSTNKLKSITINIKKEVISNLFGNIESGVHKYQYTKKIKYFYYFLTKIILNKTKLNNDEIEDIILKNIIYILLNVTSETDKTTRYNQFSQISQYIHNNIHKDESITEIANLFDMSDRTMRNVFSSIINMPPKKYQKCIKVNYLKKMLLKNKEHSISKSIYNLNFHNQSLLTKDFISIFDKSPNKFKSFYFTNSI